MKFGGFNMNIKNVFASAGLISLIIAATLIVEPTKAAASSVTRIGGINRYETAAQAATSSFKDGSENVVLVSGEGYADSISASVLARKLNAPILFTGSETLDLNVITALETLKTKNIFIIGGEASISRSIEDRLKSDYAVTRLGASDRYSTNLVVANYLVSKLGASRDKVLVVSGAGFSDALSAAPVAAAKDEILLLANNNIDSMKDTAYFAKDAAVTVIGTANSISNDVYDQLKADRRIDGGSDRFATNLSVLKEFNSDLKADKLYIANASGDGYADALVASTLSGKYSAPLVLTDVYGSEATDNAIDYLNKNAGKYNTSNIYIIGGTGVVPDAIINSINPGSSDGSQNNSQYLASATNAVAKAENSKLQSDVDSAKTLVDALTDGSDKTALLNRLQAVQYEINKTNGSVVTTPEQFSDLIENALVNFDSSLNVTIENYSSSVYNLNAIMDEIFKYNPDLNFEYKGTELSALTSGNTANVILTFSYHDSKENLIQKKNKIDAKITKIVNSVTNFNMSDYEKELALHDYLVNNCKYDPRVLAGNIPDSSDDTYNAYGALINGTAVCQGYADAMYRLLKAVGIENMMVLGTVSDGVQTVDHAWNIVKIGGQCYQLDSTFDDPSYKDGGSHPTHDYFNVTDDFLSRDHTWDKSKYPVCNSSEYTYK